MILYQEQEDEELARKLQEEFLKEEAYGVAGPSPYTVIPDEAEEPDVEEVSLVVPCL